MNRITTPVLNDKSPFEMLFGSLPNLHELKVFGSLAYASTLSVHRTKLSLRGRKCIFLGYKQGVKGSILFALITKEIFISRNITHHDHILLYHTATPTTQWQYHTNLEAIPSNTDPTNQHHNNTISPTLN
jgi:hypothetical protein